MCLSFTTRIGDYVKESPVSISEWMARINVSLDALEVETNLEQVNLFGGP